MSADAQKRQNRRQFLEAPIDILAPFRTPLVDKLRQFVCHGPEYLTSTQDDYAAAVDAIRPIFVCIL